MLPLLVAGDVCAVAALHQHVRWEYVRRMLLPACIGVVLAALSMSRISDAAFRPLIGWIVLALAVMQAARQRWPNWMGAVPHTRTAVWVIGLIAGGATMLANAAGPVVSLYCIAVGLPKFEVVGTLAWFFLIVNVFKLPFSAGLGLIRGDTLLVAARAVTCRRDGGLQRALDPAPPAAACLRCHADRVRGDCGAAIDLRVSWGSLFDRQPPAKRNRRRRAGGYCVSKNQEISPDPLLSFSC